MPKNKGKGGKNRRRGKNENEGLKRELVFREDGQEYAQVTKMLGNGRLEAMCFDGVKRLCHIRGKLRKKVWIAQSDIVLVGLRDYQDAKADVILKYSPDEARNLKSYGEFPESVKINETVTFGEEGYDDEIEIDQCNKDCPVNNPTKCNPEGLGFDRCDNDCPEADKENSIMSQNINARSRMKLNATQCHVLSQSNTVRTEKRKSARSLLRRFLFQLKEYEDAGRVYNKI